MLLNHLAVRCHDRTDLQFTTRADKSNSIMESQAVPLPEGRLSHQRDRGCVRLMPGLLELGHSLKAFRTVHSGTSKHMIRASSTITAACISCRDA